MVRQVKVWIRKCDKCGCRDVNGSHGGDIGASYFETKKQALNLSRSAYDLQFVGNKMVCRHCRQIEAMK